MLDLSQNSALGLLCPMHCVLSRSGHILSAGPTLQKLCGGGALTGQRFLEVFALLRPRKVTTMSDLVQLHGRKLHLRLRDGAQTPMKGIIVKTEDGGAVVNLSFGISILDAVHAYDLTSADFAPTDLAVEMLYLMEAKTAAMEESKKLNMRLETAKSAAEEQALTDALTGLHNRRSLDQILEQVTAAGEAFTLLHVDLDYFKTVNDTLGHAAGDFVLENVAKVLRSETRAGDTVARVGGDEFVIVMRKMTNSENIVQFAGRIIAKLERPIMQGDQMCQISASIGIVRSDDYTDPNLAQMNADADLALYESKRKGRGCYTMFSDITGTSQDACDRRAAS